MPVSSDFSNPFSNMLEELLLITGTVSLVIIILNYMKTRKRPDFVAQT
jgi:hypothetical protein